MPEYTEELVEAVAAAIAAVLMEGDVNDALTLEAAARAALEIADKRRTEPAEVGAEVQAARPRRCSGTLWLGGGPHTWEERCALPEHHAGDHSESLRGRRPEYAPDAPPAAPAPGDPVESVYALCEGDRVSFLEKDELADGLVRRFTGTVQRRLAGVDHGFAGVGQGAVSCAAQVLCDGHSPDGDTGERAWFLVEATPAADLRLRRLSALLNARTKVSAGGQHSAAEARIAAEVEVARKAAKAAKAVEDSRISELTEQLATATKRVAQLEEEFVNYCQAAGFVPVPYVGGELPRPLNLAAWIALQRMEKEKTEGSTATREPGGVLRIEIPDGWAVFSSERGDHLSGDTFVAFTREAATAHSILFAGTTTEGDYSPLVVEGAAVPAIMEGGALYVTEVADITTHAGIRAVLRRETEESAGKARAAESPQPLLRPIARLAEAVQRVKEARSLANPVGTRPPAVETLGQRAVEIFGKGAGVCVVESPDQPRDYVVFGHTGYPVAKFLGDSKDPSFAARECERYLTGRWKWPWML